MALFRYDVILRKGGGQAPAAAPRTVICPEPCSLDALRALLQDEPACVRVTGIRNARLVAEVEVVESVARGPAGSTVADLQASLDRRAAALDPEDVRTLDPRYEGIIEFSRERADAIDVTFRHRTKQPLPSRISRVSELGPRGLYANAPARPAATGAALIPALREQVRGKLPEYMVPSAWVVMDALPITPNGKIDRRALPAPERPQSAGTTREPPKNDIERSIVGVLRELLGGGDIGVDDNFFDLGANSLMMVQASVRLRSVLGRPVPLVHMFQHPTARLLAAALGEPDKTTDASVKQSQNRARMRTDAMQKRRDDARTRR
jgi:hypothetical protein